MRPYSYLVILGLTCKTVFAGIQVEKDDCYWLSGAYGVDLNCDPDHVVVGACGAGREAECPHISWEQILCCPVPLFNFGHCSTHGTYHGQDNSCLNHGNYLFSYLSITVRPKVVSLDMFGLVKCLQKLSPSK